MLRFLPTPNQWQTPDVHRNLKLYLVVLCPMRVWTVSPRRLVRRLHQHRRPNRARCSRSGNVFSKIAWDGVSFQRWQLGRCPYSTARANTPNGGAVIAAGGPVVAVARISAPEALLMLEQDRDKPGLVAAERLLADLDIGCEQ
jgi:hypothetical protein